jgi:hypothetical protein
MTSPPTDNPPPNDPLPSAGRSLGELISPDDWRLYHFMRELDQEARARIIEFAQLLFDLRHATGEAKRRTG